ncbi:hypothetical protein PPS11_26284 [Pseudomonas putida S11]|nr:hypothetical protein PPS11_26284 [Pseudomonas putida S11]
MNDTTIPWNSTLPIASGVSVTAPIWPLSKAISSNPGKAHRQLIEQGQGRRCFRQPRATHHHRGRPPGQPGDHAKGIPQQGAAIHVLERHAAGKTPWQCRRTPAGSQAIAAAAGVRWAA